MEDGVCSLSAERLATLLQEKAGELLMLDLRSFMSFNQCHLQSSINVCVPQALLKRKNFSLSCVESTIPCDKSREKFKNRQGSDIVLYDSDCEKVKKNCVLSALVQKLKDESLVNGVFFLHGGFQSFAQKFPQFCFSKDSPCSAAGVSHGFSLHLARPMLHLTPAHTPNNDVTDKEPVQIFDYLFVGGEGVSSSLPTLEKYGITYVLNAAKECPDAHTADPRFTYLRLDLLDCAAQDIDLALFDRAFAFIDEAREKGQKILVHCKAGQSRSATIVISYIIRTHRWSLQQSYKFVQGKRPSVSPNLGFIAQLIRFENVVLGQSTSIQQLICSEPASTTATTTTTTTQQPLPLTPIETSAPLASLVSIGCK